MPKSRLVLAAGLVGGLIGGPAIAALQQNADIPFQVNMGGAPIGKHSVRFEEKGDELHVFIDIKLEVGLAFITLYEYEHSNHEVWRDGRLTSIETRTNDDGELYTVTGEATEDGFRVEGSEGVITAPADVAPTSYWSQSMLGASAFLDTQRGRIVDLAVDDATDDLFRASNGDWVKACRVSLRGDLNVDAWYDDEGRWVKMAFQLKGSDFDYDLLRPVRAPVGATAAADCTA